MPEPIRLDGTCVLVTGGSMGIGLAAAEACLRAGGQVGICARSVPGIEAAVTSLRERGFDHVIGLRCDVTCEPDLERALDDLESQFGPMGAVIHAAGVLGPIGPLMDLNPDEWLDTIKVNLFGSFLVVARTAARLARHGGGRIVLFSGGGAAGPFPYYTAYACSKVGVVRLTETAAAELAPLHIEINCVAPGFVVTRLHDETLAAGDRAGSDYLKRTRDEIEKGGVPPSVGADAAVFLISEAARGITGRFVAAPYDDFTQWPSRAKDLVGSDLFTLRRIVPLDRGMDWH